MLQMTIEPRALVVIAGLPGSGKSTLLRRMAADEPIAVLDSDQMRDRLAARMPAGTPYSRYRPLVHILHRLHVTVSAFSRAGPVVVHDPATGAPTRTWLLLLGLFSRRSRHFVWVECSPSDALAGQRTRGRVLRCDSFQRHVRRLPRLHAALRHGPRGWTRTRIIDRGRAKGGLRLVVSDGAEGPSRSFRPS